MKYKIKYQRISHIFISHLHGDHYLGLMGLLSTMHLQGRTNELHLYGQQELMDIVELQLRLSNTVLKYSLIFHPTKHYLSEIIFEDDDVLVKTIIMNHRIPCTGFLFREKEKPRKLLVKKLQQFSIPFSYYSRIKQGEDFEDDFGKVIKNSELTQYPPPAKSYAYCSDTLYDENIIDEVKEVDLLYFESTFIHEHLERAAATYHATSIQAGTMAQKARVKQLLIGHFSARYKTLLPLLAEAVSVFPNTQLAEEGKKFVI